MDGSTGTDKGAFRVKDWWWSKAALLMGMIYLFAARYHIPFELFVFLALLSLTTIAGFASTGYLLNDLFDIKKDALAGKRNFLAGKPAWQVILFFLISTTCMLFPWWILPTNPNSFLLIGAELLLFIIYSIPPIRLKERGVAGIVTDALYAHGLPPILAAYTYSLAALFYMFPTTDIVILFIWQTVAGFRNILLHQLEDIDADKISGSKNYVAGITSAKFNLLLRLTIGIELLLGVTFFTVLLSVNKLFVICLLAVVVLSAIAFSIFRNKDIGQFLSSPWKFFPNNIYEKWLPVTYLILLSVGDVRFIILLIIHIAIFNFDLYIQSADKLYGRWKSVAFKGLLIDLKVFLSYPVNYFIFYSFKIFGVDLKKENISSLAYLRGKLGLRNTEPNSESSSEKK